MKKWLRNFVIIAVLKNLKRTATGAKLLKMAEGYKTGIGRILLLITSIIAVLQYAYPQHPIVGEVAVIVGLVVSWLAIEMGIEDKNLRGEPVVYDPAKEFDIDLGKFKITVPPVDDFKAEDEKEVK